MTCEEARALQGPWRPTPSTIIPPSRMGPFAYPSCVTKDMVPHSPSPIEVELFSSLCDVVLPALDRCSCIPAPQMRRKEYPLLMSFPLPAQEQPRDLVGGTREHSCSCRTRGRLWWLARHMKYISEPDQLMVYFILRRIAGQQTMHSSYLYGLSPRPGRATPMRPSTCLSTNVIRQAAAVFSCSHHVGWRYSHS